MEIHKYAYKHYNPFAWPGAFADAYRAEEFEQGNLNYAILQPNPPYDDDSMLVRWDTAERRWITNFAMVIRGGTFPIGDVIQNNSDSGERAALVLLGYFGLEDRANEFTPEEISNMSPSDLERLAKEPVKTPEQMAVKNKNFGLKHFVETYPYRGYPFDVSEDGKRFMMTLYLRRGSTTEDFKALAQRAGLENALPGEPNFDIDTDYRPHNQIHARAGNIFQIFAKRFQDTIELGVYGLMEDIISFIDRAEEGELISQPELYLGSIAYHLLRGKALWETGSHLDEAVAEYEQGLKSGSPRTTNPVISRSFEDMVADLHYNLGLVFNKKGESPRAVEEFRAYLEHDSTTEWAEQARRYISELSRG